MPNVKGPINHMDVDVKDKRLFVAGLENGSLEVVDLSAGKWSKSNPGDHRGTLRPPRFKIGASFTNVLNHPSIVDDSDHFNLDIGSAGFGQISAVRGSDFGGSRTGQIFARIEF
jgi:hypothetical protein